MIWAAIVRIFTGGTLNKLAAAYRAKQDAQTEQERIAADVEIARMEQQQKNREIGGRITALVQCAWAAPFIAYNAKLVLWDKMLGLGVTDPLSADLVRLEATMVSFYFGGAAVIGAVRAIKR